MKPTVSLTSTRGTASGWRARTVVSSVAKSLSATSASLCVSARIRVDLPAFVYPTSATRARLPRSCRRARCVLRSDPIASSSFCSSAMRSRILRRSSSPGAPPAAAAAGTAARPVLRPGELRRLAHPRRHIAQTRNLHLRARETRARVPVKDLENHHRTVHHLAADLLREVELLRRRDL